MNVDPLGWTHTTQGVSMKRLIATAVAGAAIATAAAGLTGAGTADARGLDHHGIKLTKSQTAAVAQHGIGYAISAIPRIPNLIYNPTFGRIIQADAEYAARRGGCIEFGIAVPKSGGANLNYISTYPASACAN